MYKVKQAKFRASSPAKGRQIKKTPSISAEGLWAESLPSVWTTAGMECVEVDGR